jgi:hypothetical protein
VIAAFALLACAPQSSRAEPAADDASPSAAERPAGKTDFEWSGELAAAGRVEIGNVNGDIRVRPSTGKQVRVRGTKSGKDAAELRIDVAVKSGRVTIEPKYPERRNHFDASVDFVVEVPSGIAVEAEVVNGNVDAQDIHAAVELSSVNGTIAATDCPDVRGNTVNGRVRVQLPKSGAKRAKLEAVNGELEVRMAAGDRQRRDPPDEVVTRQRGLAGRYCTGQCTPPQPCSAAACSVK